MARLFNYLIEYPAALGGPARARLLMGDQAGARKSYEEFLDLRREADPEVLLSREARTEYEKLRK